MPFIVERLIAISHIVSLGQYDRSYKDGIQIDTGGRGYSFLNAGVKLMFVGVPLKRLGYYREERDGSVVVGVRSVIDFRDWNNFGNFERSWEDGLLDA